MKSIEVLYKPFLTKGKYKDINEINILKSLYKFNKVSLEVAISQIINEAVLGHMNLCIDSTIMQMLALNEYLCSLFKDNFRILCFNYMIAYIEASGVEEVEETLEIELSRKCLEVEMSTTLEELQKYLQKIV